MIVTCNKCNNVFHVRDAEPQAAYPVRKKIVLDATEILEFYTTSKPSVDGKLDLHRIAVDAFGALHSAEQVLSMSDMERERIGPFTIII